jgi:hypothetical protein
MNVQGMLADGEVGGRVKGKREVTAGVNRFKVCIYIYIYVYVYVHIHIYIYGDNRMKPTEYIFKRRGAKKVKNAKHHNMRMSL